MRICYEATRTRSPMAKVGGPRHTSHTLRTSKIYNRWQESDTRYLSIALKVSTLSDRDKMTDFPPDDPITIAQFIPWLEFGGWTALALTPMLYFLNGPAVSPDQFVVRCGLTVMAITLGPGLTVVRIVRSRRAGRR